MGWGPFVKKIGVRDLKSQLNNVVRSVREQQVEYTVTVHGEPVAVLRPYTEEDSIQDREAMIDRELAMIDELADEIGRSWSSDESPLGILARLREESACR